MANRKLFPGAVKCITVRVLPAADVSNGAAAACAISIFNAMRRKSSCFSDHVALPALLSEQSDRTAERRTLTCEQKDGYSWARCCVPGVRAAAYAGTHRPAHRVCLAPAA